MNLLDLAVKITVDDSGVDSGLNKITSSFEKVKNNVGSVIKTASKIGAVVTTVGTALTAVGVDTAAEVRAEASAFEQTFGDMQDTATKAIGRVADESGILQTRLNALGSKIYAFARSSGGDATESMNLMERALKAAADSAAYYDTSVEQATETLQSFLKGNFANDAALGLSATETTRNAAAMELFGQKYNELSEIQKQETLLKMVEDSQKLSGALGQASREADGWENVLGNLKESWRQLKAAFGEPILDSVTPMLQNATAAVQDFTAKVDWEKVANVITTGFDSAVDACKTLMDTLNQIIPVVGVAAGAFASLKAGMAIQHLVQGFQNAQVAISLLTMGLNNTTLAQAALNGTMTVGETIVALLTGKMTLAQFAQAAMTKGQLALNTALSANPIGAVIAVVGALTAAVVVLWNTNDDFRNAIISAWGKITETISGAVSAIKTFFTETIPNAARTALDWFHSIPEQMKEVGRNLLMGLWDGITDKVEWLKGKVTGVVNAIKGWFTGKDGFDEHSPSKWSRGVFRYVMEGGAEGLSDGLPALMRGVSVVSGRVKNGLDFETATVGFADSGVGRSSAAIVNGISNSPTQTINLLANLVLPDGSKIASFIFDDLVKYAAANGTPIANPQMA